ncbi:hypothetical protein [Pseudoalteromonas piratica]|uniref:Iron transporter n=1 Tax=Pseudoalteromonas piratica TaxID=1348114 RepID=A0A0A7EMM6_9GAMM|nr:hypothetical protein [Pseudoalteromonas piratica]AIY67326.1 hypothetical protein OM33_20000 [Pseudoalteromonas piratica]
MDHALTLIRANKDVISRIFVAVIMGYGITMSLSILLSVLLPLNQTDAIAASSMLSFAVFTGFVMFVFSAKSIKQVFFQSLGVLVVSAALNVLFMAV